MNVLKMFGIDPEEIKGQMTNIGMAAKGVADEQARIAQHVNLLSQLVLQINKDMQLIKAAVGIKEDEPESKTE
jgi:hypothetical protein